MPKPKSRFFYAVIVNPVSWLYNRFNPDILYTSGFASTGLGGAAQVSIHISSFTMQGLVQSVLFLSG